MKKNEEGTGLISEKWQTHDACLCIVCLVFSQIIINALIIYLLPKHLYLRSPLGLFVTYICSSLIILFITILYSRVRSVEEFMEQFGFLSPNIYTVAMAALSGGAIATLAVCFMKIGLSAPASEIGENLVSGDIGYFYFLALWSPFWEEVVMRGYFYKAFRQEYSVPISTCCVFGISIISHVATRSNTLLGIISLLGLTIITSLFRERTKSIWNCIVCHFAYNVICLFV